MPDVIVVGAGITGLTCAYRLQKLGFDPLLLESSDRVGGVIRSERIGEYLVEWGPNSLLPSEHMVRLLDELDLSAQLIRANPKSPRYIVMNGQLKRVPFGPLTLAGIARAMAEPFIKSRSGEDESVASFFRRRFGTEIHTRLVEPALTGIYAGDTERLSAAACLPRVVEMERKYGSVILGLLRGRSSKPRLRGLTTSSFESGVEILPQRLAGSLNVRLKASGIRIGKDVQAKATVLAIPSYRAAEAIEHVNPDAAQILAAIEYEPMVVAATSLAIDSLKKPLRGFGFLVPPAERLDILGTVFSSCLYPGRAPEGRMLLTSFLGGGLKPEAFDWPDERVWDVVCSQLKRLLGSSVQPTPLALVRHRRAIPQYNIGHKRRTKALMAELARDPGLFLTGNFLDGVSVAACIEHGDKTAHTVAEFLRSSK